jgi:DNA gyrase/topoisomerase IV subunit B
MVDFSEYDLDMLLEDFSALPAIKKVTKAAARDDTAVSKSIMKAAGEVVPSASADINTISTLVDHARKKGMWAGALTRVAMPGLQGVVRAAAVEEKVDDDEKAAPRRASAVAALGVELVDIAATHTPALLKIMDEILVNATDHAKGQETAAPSARVTRIEVTFDAKTGEVSIFNDGPGIPVTLNAAATKTAGREVYEPEVSMSYFLAGTNIDKELDNVKGGINGLGAKLANVHSDEFIIETVDAKHYYRQRFRDRLAVTELPTVTPVRGGGLTAAQARPHTRVSFRPAYAELGYKLTAAKTLARADADDLSAWLCLRAHQAAAYAGAKVAVSFNGARCLTTDAGALGNLLLTPFSEEEAAQAIVLTAQAKAAEAPYKAHPWNIAVVVLPPGKKAGRRAASQNMTIVNGVLTNKGSHIQYIKKMLSGAVEGKLRRATKRGAGAAAAAPKDGAAVAKALALGKAGKKAAAPKPAAKSGNDDQKAMSTTETLAGVRLVMCGAIPGADWGGQRKDELQVAKELLERYTLADAFLKRVGDAVAERILIAQGAKNPAKVVHDKYTPARRAGKAAHKRHTYLMAAEGDSAITLLKAGLTQTRAAAAPGGPSLDWAGIISLQGVIVNAAREVKEIETSGGETINVRSAKLQNNKRLLALADALGLKYGVKYDTPEQRATLHYGKLLLCVDQDLDGTGKIAALVLVWIWLFWPALIGAGFVGRFMTPLVRVYPKRAGQPVEFFYESELESWLAEDPTRAAAYHPPKYYKGLATHSAEEVKHMFVPKAFAQSIYTYTLDAETKRLFEVYFGAEAALRKEVLVTPVVELTAAEAAELHRRREIPVGRVQLSVDTKLYKNDAIKRQISGGVDGLNPARRKILMGAALRFASESSKKELKIFQLGGAVADRMHYHHGDASLNSTIIYMAQAFRGARRYPYLLGVGQFGDRHGGAAGSARYISVKLGPLMHIVFPTEDRWLLKYVFEDGERAEPQFFIPVVPMAVLESYKIVSEGWNHDSHARDPSSVLAIVDAYLSGEPTLVALGDRLHAEGPTPAVIGELERAASQWPLPASTQGYAGEVRRYRGEMYSFGMYSWNEEARTITITELPMGLTTAKYVETLMKPGRNGAPNPRAELIENIEDHSSTETVELLVKLHDGAFEKMSETFGDSSIDPLEDALMLRASLRPHLNYYSANGGVLEFKDCYLAAVLYWAPLRRDLYRERIERERIITELRILEETEILRYISLAAELDLARVENDETAVSMLKDRQFPPINVGLLHRPEYTPNVELRERVLADTDSAFNYILNLRERDLVKTAYVKRERLLDKLRTELARAESLLAERPIPCASLWRSEIAAFTSATA